MRNVKILGIEYALWLYIIACVSWLFLRLWERSVATPVILGLPLIIAALLLLNKSNLASKIAGVATKGILWKVELIIVLSLSLIMAWVIVEVKPLDFLTQAANTRSILSGIFNPNPAELVPMLAALMETIFLALLATVFAIPFAFVLSFFAAKNLMFGSLWGKLAYLAIRTVSTIFRSIEAIVWAIIFCVWVGIGPFAGMLALWIHSIAALIKLYSEQIENIDAGPVEAIKATGASTLQVWRYAVAPQILAPYLAFTIYRWDINVRMSTVIGMVGGGGIGYLLIQWIRLLDYRSAGIAIWFIAITVAILDYVSSEIRNRFV
jgi:phosphonate transport system permease protein